MSIIFYLPAIVISGFPCFFLRYVFRYLHSSFSNYPYAGPISMYLLMSIPLFLVSFIGPMGFGGLPADENAGEALVLYFQGACIGFLIFTAAYWTTWKFA